MTPNAIDTLDAFTLLARSVLRLEIIRFLPRLPYAVSDKEKLIRFIFGAHVGGLDVGIPLCTNRIRSWEGLRQLEMFIPFRGKKGVRNRQFLTKLGDCLSAKWIH